MKRTVRSVDYTSRNSLISKAIEAFLSSPQLARSKTTHALAQYLLNEELSGRGDKLTPYAVGVDALKVGSDFDPSTDSRLRVEMKRLRDALSEFNETNATKSGVTIDIPPRQYRPRFLIEDRTKAKDALATTPWLRGSLVASLVIALVLIFQLGFNSTAQSLIPESRAAADRTASMLHLHLRDLTGSARSNDSTIRLATALKRLSRVDVMINNDVVGKVFMSPESYVISIHETGEDPATNPNVLTVFTVHHALTGEFVTSVAARLSDDLQDQRKRSEQISKMASSLANYRGVIQSDYYRRGDISPTMACLQKMDTYMTEHTDEAHLAARDCSEQLIAQDVRVAELYLSLAGLNREEATDQRNLRPGDPIARALDAAQKAMNTNPDLAEAYYIAATIHGLSGNPFAMKRLGLRAIEMSPYEARFLAGIGYLLTIAGEFEEGLKLQLKAEQLEPNAPAWRDYGIFLAQIALGNEEEFVSRGISMGSSNDPLNLAAYAIAAELAGKHQDAYNALRKAETLSFVGRGEFRASYDRRSYHPDLIEKLVERLEAVDGPHS